jgi:hypothetical protein
VPRRRLALALLGAACVAVAATVTLVAFSALIVFGARLGALELTLAVVGVPLQFALAVVLSRLAGRGHPARARSRSARAPRRAASARGSHRSRVPDVVPGRGERRPAAGAVALMGAPGIAVGLELTGGVARVWFLALYMPDPWQWPTIALMATLGIGALVLAARAYAPRR